MFQKQNIVANGEARKIWNCKIILKDTKLNITNKGKRYLGAVVGTKEYRKEYVIMRVYDWINVHLLQPIENFIRQEFITSLFEWRTFYSEEHQLLSLPVKFGGMGITNILQYQT